MYKYSSILHVPTFGKHVFSFGTTMHSTLQKFFSNAVEQSSLFSEVAPNTKFSPPSLDHLLHLYEESWIDDWYENKAAKQKQKEKGKKSLKEFYKLTKENPPQVLGLETNFNLPLGPYTMGGRIDRYDKLDNGVEIIDYKTGESKTKIYSDDKDQLLLYQIAAEEVLKLKPVKLTYWYLDDNKPASFIGTKEDKEKLKTDFLERIKKIQNHEFSPTPGKHICGYCDFKEICEFRAD